MSFQASLCILVVAVGIVRSAAAPLEGNSSCTGPVLLQLVSKLDQQASSLSPRKSSCPGDGKKCTLIAVLKEGADGDKIAKPYAEQAQVSHLKAVGELILDFGKHQAENCCKASKELGKVSGVESVEFDQPVHFANDANVANDASQSLPTKQIHAALEAKESDAWGARSRLWHADSGGQKQSKQCPPTGELCTVTVMLEAGNNAKEIMEAFHGVAEAVSFNEVGHVVLEFGSNHPDKCCLAYELVQNMKGVKAVDFAKASVQNGARLGSYYSALVPVLLCVLNAIRWQ